MSQNNSKHQKLLLAFRRVSLYHRLLGSSLTTTSVTGRTRFKKKTKLSFRNNSQNVTTYVRYPYFVWGKQGRKIKVIELVAEYGLYMQPFQYYSSYYSLLINNFKHLQSLETSQVLSALSILNVCMYMHSKCRHFIGKCRSMYRYFINLLIVSLFSYLYSKNPISNPLLSLFACMYIEN